ncbi:ImmA/IrrE family metallo-endopeptidase [Georgenia sp. AZ-5]|uniref:ImmA/IrrE family metallo-endopeptidase n=1 Tax=Georgenia sp. AZ-5 TaxID=3367526 RepID=UPI0037554031
MSIDFHDLAARHDYRGIAAALIDSESARGVYDFARLADDPIEEIERGGELEVHLDQVTPSDCGVAGYYRPRGPRGPQIVVHPSWTITRDNFTVLHEFAHHLQRTHLQWADVWCLLPERESSLINERAADAFAAEVLLPGDRVGLAASEVTARDLARVHLEAMSASRSAIAHGALREARPADNVAVAVVDLTGQVVYAKSVGTVMAPRRGAVQNSIARLVRRAVDGDGQASGVLDPGLVTASGYVQDNLVATLALDATGHYAFVVVRPLHRRAAPTWRREEYECQVPACAAVFVSSESTRWCGQCEGPHCPECGSCACDLEASNTCTKCQMALSVVERTDPSLHECW